MPQPLVVVRFPALLEPAQWARVSEDAWARAASPTAELRVGIVATGPDDGEAATLLGAFQRPSDAAADGEDEPFYRRATGGGAVRVGEGSVHVGLSLPSPGALVDCDETRLLNRYVRPILKALGRVGAPAHYFDRDWIAVARRPAAWIGFAHDATTGASLVEAWIGLRVPFASGLRESFAGKAPGSVEALAGRAVDGARLVDAVVEAFAGSYDVELVETVGEEPAPATVDAPRGPDGAWAATTREPFGVLGAGPDGADRMRLGGDVMISRDAVRELEARLAELRGGGVLDEDDVRFAVHETLGAPGVVAFGVRDLGRVAELILAAARASRQ